MASIQRRGENSFQLTIELGYDGRGKRIRRTKTIRIKDEKLLRAPRRLENYLKQELYTFQAKVESGHYIDTSNIKFSEFVDDWIEKHAKLNLEKTTFNNYMIHLNNYIIPHFGNSQLNKIKTIHIVNFLNKMSQPGASVRNSNKALSDSTIYELDKTMRVVLNKAKEWQVIKESPMDGLPRPRIRKKDIQYFDEDDIYDFIKAIYQEHIVWRTFFLTSAMSGMRRAEVIALTWEDIDFDEGCIVLKRSIPVFVDGKPYVKGTKTNEGERIIHMPDWYMIELKTFKKFWNDEKYACGDKWQGGEKNFLFHGGFGKPYTPNAATNTWKRIVNDHGLKEIRLHDLRHTMITYLLNSGESAFMVSKRAGHSSTKVTTETYGHFEKRGGKAIVKHLEKFNPINLVSNRSAD